MLNGDAGSLFLVSFFLFLLGLPHTSPFFNAFSFMLSSFSQRLESTHTSSTLLYVFAPALYHPSFLSYSHPFVLLLLVLGCLELLLGSAGAILDILSLRDKTRHYAGGFEKEKGDKM